MYEFIAGTIEARSATSVVIAAAGVGYELLAPLGAPFPAPGETAKVSVHLVVREDAQTLYGFPSRDDRDLFRILLRVRGVGPSMALGVLSGMSAAEIAGAVARDDLKAFTAIKGVGKKTAEQILLDLRDKSALLASVAGAAPAAPEPLEPGRPHRPSGGRGVGSPGRRPHPAVGCVGGWRVSPWKCLHSGGNGQRSRVFPPGGRTRCPV